MGKPLLDALAGNKPERMPIWLMRQAGRYLPEYRQLRSQTKNFIDLCLTPELATEITLQPIKRFGFDAAILFADILLVPYALGQKLEFREGEGPLLEKLADDKTIGGLEWNATKLAPVFKTVQSVKMHLPAKTALIGFCGAPWTVAAYMIDGSSRENFVRARSWAAEYPERLQQLTNILIDASADYLCRQIEAGAEALQIFESWAELLKGDDFTRWIIEPTCQLIRRVKQKHPHIPIIGFPRGAGAHYRAYAAKTGIDALGIDQHISLDSAQNELRPLKILQGNLDPALLVKGGADMRKAAEAIMEKLGPRHIFNLGHGVAPQTPLEHVAELISIVRGYKI